MKLTVSMTTVTTVEILRLIGSSVDLNQGKHFFRRGGEGRGVGKGGGRWRREGGPLSGIEHLDDVKGAYFLRVTIRIRQNKIRFQFLE